MAYIGKQPTTGDFILLDSITTSATASYTMQRNSVNFEPQSANHMIVSLNGTIQAPVSSFTVSGSTLTFASALTSSDVIDFILVLGNVNDVGVASSVVDSAITKNKLNLISDSSSAGLTVKGDGSSQDGYIAINCSQNSHAVKIKAPPHSAAQSYTLTLPSSITNNYFLKTDGSGNLSFAEAGGGDLVLINATDNSSSHSGVDIDGLFSSTYRNYKIFFETTATSGGQSIQGQLRSSSGAFSNGDYDYHFRRLMSDSDSTNIRRDRNQTKFQLTDSTDSDTQRIGATFEFTILNPNSSSTRKSMLMTGIINDTSGIPGYVFGGCQIKTSTAMVGISFFPGGGSFQNSSFRCYGIKDS